MATIAILEDSYWDIPISNMLRIVSALTGREIVIVKAWENITDQLDQLYSWGYRRFIGFSRSAVFIQVIDWFSQRNDCLGISCTSTLDIDKPHPNLLRLTPVDSNAIDSYVYYCAGKKVLVILESDPAMINIWSRLKSRIMIDTVYFDSFKTSMLKNYDVIVPLIMQKQKYLSMISGLDNVPLHVDNVGEIPPSLPSNIKNYIFIQYRPEMSRIVYELMSQYNGISPSAYDAFQLAVGGNSPFTTGAYGMLYFNQNGDRLNYVYAHHRFDGHQWKIVSGNGYEPGLGSYTLTIN